MGVKINSQGNPDTPFLKSMGTILNLVCKRIFHLWLQPDWLFKLFPMYKVHQENIAILHNFTNKVCERIVNIFINRKYIHRNNIESYRGPVVSDLSRCSKIPSLNLTIVSMVYL